MWTQRGKERVGQIEKILLVKSYLLRFPEMLVIMFKLLSVCVYYINTLTIIILVKYQDLPYFYFHLDI